MARRKDCVRAQDARIVNQDTRCAEGFFNLLHCRRNGIGIRNIAAEELDVCICRQGKLSAFTRRPGCGRTALERGWELLDVEDCDCDALCNEPFDNERADAATAPCHDRDLAIPFPALLLRLQAVAVEGEVVERFVHAFKETEGEKPFQCPDDLRMACWVAEGSDAAC